MFGIELKTTDYLFIDGKKCPKKKDTNPIQQYGQGKID